jgi:double-stranded uracil-DNA glycosylase
VPLRAGRPSPADLAAAANRTIPDVLPGAGEPLRVLFCGINPSLYSAAIGHHFGRPGNRFWPALHLGGFTPWLLSPFEDGRLVEFGCGVTNLADRATATADEVSQTELVEGARRLEEKAAEFRPAWVAVLGVTAYRTAFGRPKAALGRQAEAIASAAVWVLPNPSGLNAHYRLDDLGRLFAELRRASGVSAG